MSGSQKQMIQAIALWNEPSEPSLYVSGSSWKKRTNCFYWHNLCAIWLHKFLMFLPNISFQFNWEFSATWPSSAVDTHWSVNQDSVYLSPVLGNKVSCVLPIQLVKFQRPSVVWCDFYGLALIMGRVTQQQTGLSLSYGVELNSQGTTPNLLSPADGHSLRRL